MLLKSQNDNRASLKEDLVEAVATRQCILNSRLKQIKSQLLNLFEIEAFQEASYDSAKKKSQLEQAHFF